MIYSRIILAETSLLTLIQSEKMFLKLSLILLGIIGVLLNTTQATRFLAADSTSEDLTNIPIAASLRGGEPDSDRPDCAKDTTLSYCLEDKTYPKDLIQKEISLNYGEFYKMYAEVANQSASSLVDGVSDDEEINYNYKFYYGNKRNYPVQSSDLDSVTYANYTFREDYYKDGGYICPSFIDYAQLYQALNARGEWQYVVNVKPWVQTVRLEQCFYPMARCSYVSKTINSQCVQKYSFQRLIAYEPQSRGGRGLYTDVFRLPTACACHIKPARKKPFRGGSGTAYQEDASQAVDFIAKASSDDAVQSPPRNFIRSESAPSRTFSWTTQGSGQPQTSASILVETRRIRPVGLSEAEVSQREYDRNQQPYDAPASYENFFDGRSRQSRPPPPPFPPSTPSGPMRPPNFRSGPQFQGEASGPPPAFFGPPREPMRAPPRQPGPPGNFMPENSPRNGFPMAGGPPGFQGPFDQQGPFGPPAMNGGNVQVRGNPQPPGFIDWNSRFSGGQQEQDNRGGPNGYNEPIDPGQGLPLY